MSFFTATYLERPGFQKIICEEVTKTGQPNRLVLTETEKLLHLKVQRTDWALLGKPWGALSFWVVGRAPFLKFYCSVDISQAFALTATPHRGV